MPRDKNPNVLIIMSDQHNANILGCAGDPVVHTPALDRLATQGARFTNAYCTFPLCGPSRMSFMTCRRPHEIGLWDNEGELCSGIPTFAHAFLADGYDTVLSGRMHFVGWDQRHGFVRRLIGDVGGTAYLSKGWRLEPVLGDLIDTPGMSLAGVVKSGPGRTGYHAYDEAVTRATVNWLEQCGRDPDASPFLLTVGYVSPHCPFVAPPKDFEYYASRIDQDDLPVVPDSGLHPVNAERRRRFQTDPLPPRDAQWRARVAYYGLCSFIDRQVEAVISALADAGRADDTIVVYTSDHGEMLGEHGMWWKSTFYDGASRVPLIISWPDRIHGGASVGANVSLIDVGPTLMDLAGVDPLPGATGHSLVPLLEGDGGEWDDAVFAEYTAARHECASRMVRWGPWKYNYYHGERPELFNLVADPNEMNDLSGDPAHRAPALRLHDLVLRNWDPDYIEECMRRCSRERELIGNWVGVCGPPEPDPPWFGTPPENWVDDRAR